MSADPNSNFNILSKILNTAKMRHIPKLVKKFNKREHTKEKWMTNDLLKLVVKKREICRMENYASGSSIL